MKKPVKIALPCILLGLLFCTCSQALAGAWAQGHGHSYQRLGASYYFAERNFNDDGERKRMTDDGDFRDLNLNYYLEYGLTAHATLITSIYYKQIKQEDERIEIKTYGFGDLDLGIKYQIVDLTAGAIAVQGMVKIPELYDEDDTMPLGNGQYDYEIRLLYGQSLGYLFPGYCNVELGYRWRAEAPSDEFRYLVELGMDLSSQLYVRAKLDGLISAQNGDTIVDASGNPTLSSEFDLLKLDLAAGFKLNKTWGLEAVYSPALSGENTACGTTCTLALTCQIR